MFFKDGWLLEYFVWQCQNIVKEREKKNIHSMGKLVWKIK